MIDDVLDYASTLVTLAWVASLGAEVVAERKGAAYDARLALAPRFMRLMYCVGFFGDEGRALLRQANRAKASSSVAVSSNVVFLLVGAVSAGSACAPSIRLIGAPLAMLLTWQWFRFGRPLAVRAWELELDLISRLSPERHDDLQEFRKTMAENF